MDKFHTITKKAGQEISQPAVKVLISFLVVAGSEEAKQEQEQVHEVEIKVQCAH